MFVTPARVRLLETWLARVVTTHCPSRTGGTSRRSGPVVTTRSVRTSTVRSQGPRWKGLVTGKVGCVAAMASTLGSLVQWLVPRVHLVSLVAPLDTSSRVCRVGPYSIVLTVHPEVSHPSVLPNDPFTHTLPNYSGMENPYNPMTTLRHLYVIHELLQ